MAGSGDVTSLTAALITQLSSIAANKSLDEPILIELITKGMAIAAQCSLDGQLKKQALLAALTTIIQASPLPPAGRDILIAWLNITAPPLIDKLYAVASGEIQLLESKMGCCG